MDFGGLELWRVNQTTDYYGHVWAYEVLTYDTEAIILEQANDVKCPQYQIEASA